MEYKLAVDLCMNVITLTVAVYAILDTRKQTQRMVRLERDRSYMKVRNDMAWIRLDPTPEGETSGIANGLEEFCATAIAVEPTWAIKEIGTAVRNNSLAFAETLVEKGYANWKPNVNLKDVEKTLNSWRTDSNRDRIQNLLSKREGLSLF